MTKQAKQPRKSVKLEQQTHVYVGPRENLFLVKQDGIEVGVFNRNGMNRTNALAACLRNGILPAEDLNGPIFYTTHTVPSDYRFSKEPTKVRKRPAGTGPTSTYTREMIELLGGDVASIPPVDVQAKAISKKLLCEYEALHGVGEKPATVAQLDFAEDLSKRTGLALPKSRTRKRISNFIYFAKIRPQFANDYQKEQIDDINKYCADIPNFSPFFVEEGCTQWEDAQDFCERWRDFCPPDEQLLYQALLLSKLSGKAVFTQFDRITELSANLFVEFWIKLAKRHAFGSAWTRNEVPNLMKQPENVSRAHSLENQALKILWESQRDAMHEKEPLDFIVQEKSGVALHGEVYVPSDLPEIQRRLLCSQSRSGSQNNSDDMTFISQLLRLGLRVQKRPDGMLINDQIIVSPDMKFRVRGGRYWRKFEYLHELVKSVSITEVDIY